MITIKQSGDFKHTEGLCKRVLTEDLKIKLDDYGKKGVEALREATPKDTGKTAESWYYEVDMSKASVSVTWYNSNVNNGVPIAIIIQYGHATKNGGHVEGTDYINPALKEIFDKMADDVWKGVMG